MGRGAEVEGRGEIRTQEPEQRVAGERRGDLSESVVIYYYNLKK